MSINYKEVVPLVSPVMVIAKDGLVYVLQDNDRIIINQTEVEQLSESIMKAGAACIRIGTPFPPAASREELTKQKSTVSGDAVTQEIQ